MNRSTAVAIANAVQAIRPDWQQPGIIAQLQQLDQAWTGTDAALAAHVLAIAGQPTANTPGAFNATPIPQAQNAAYSGGWTKEPVCHTCGKSKSRCLEQRVFEESRGIPDPHDFESHDDADRRVARKQLTPRRDPL